MVVSYGWAGLHVTVRKDPNDFEAQRELERSSFKLLAVWAKGKTVNTAWKLKLYPGANPINGTPETWLIRKMYCFKIRSINV